MSEVQTRDAWIETMEPRMRDLFTFGLDEYEVWKKIWDVQDSNMRREEVGEYVTPDVVIETPEGAPLATLTTKMVRTSSVIHADYTGMIIITHQMNRDKKYKEMEKNTWGLGEAVARKIYEDAARFYYQGFGAATSSDNVPWFYDQHPLDQNANVYGDNLLVDVLGPDGIVNGQKLMMQTMNENGKMVPMGTGKLDLIVPPAKMHLARQLAQKGEYLPGSAEFNRNTFELNPIVVPFLAYADSAFADSQWYLRDAKKAENICFMREGPTYDMVFDPITDNYIVKTRVSYSFLLASWRGVCGSKGTGS